MRVWTLVFAAASLVLASVAFAQDGLVLKAPPEPQGMTTIFNGKDLTGWDGDPRLRSVKDGVIHGQITKEVPAQGITFIIWKEGKT